MIVRDHGDTWQVVMQPDHARACGDFARMWGNGDFRSPPAQVSLAVASERHDDGWAVWERAPDHDPDTGKPLNFLDIDVGVHLAFWRAATATVSNSDPYAGILVGMHGAGIYRGRYGIQPNLKLSFVDEVREKVDAFVREQEQRYPTFIEEFSVDEDELWADYRLLQAYDLLSLYFSGQNMPGGLTVGEPGDLTPVPVDYGDGEAVQIHVDPLGDDRYRLDPYPFAKDEAAFGIKRRLIPKQDWQSGSQFREALAKAELDTLRFTLVR